MEAESERRKRFKVTRKFLVSMRVGETPVPIPNTTVKTYAADGTALETVWESRWLPAPNQKHGEMLIEHRTGTHRSVPTWYSGEALLR